MKTFWFLTFTILLTGFAAGKSHTASADDAPVFGPHKPADAPVTIAQEEPEEDPEDVSPPPALPAEDLRAFEQAGLLVTIRQGGLGKSLWADQDRADITDRLKALPVFQSTAGFIQLKKRLLLTQADAPQTQADEQIPQGQDLLTLRLHQLVENGWYDDAYKLYTDTVDTAPHEDLAQLGLLLILFNGDFATACLEEKVIAPAYPDSPFWQKLDTLCNQELGQEADITLLEDSEVLTAITKSETFALSAHDEKTLMALSPLERAVIFALGRVRYDTLDQDRDVLKTLHPSLLMLYLRDTNTPETLKEEIRRTALERGYLSVESFRQSDPAFKAVNALQIDEEQQKAVLDILSTKISLPLLRVYSPLLKDLAPGDIPPEKIAPVLAAFLAENILISEEWLQAYASQSIENKKDMFFLDIFYALSPHIEMPDSGMLISEETPEEENILPAAPDLALLLEILDSLEVKNSLDAQRLILYEKQHALTESQDYGIHSHQLSEDAENTIKAAAQKEWTGLTVLNVLKAMDSDIHSLSPSLVHTALSSLKNVGYIDDVRALSKKIIADVIYNNKGE